MPLRLSHNSIRLSTDGPIRANLSYCGILRVRTCRNGLLPWKDEGGVVTLDVLKKATHSERHN